MCRNDCHNNTVHKDQENSRRMERLVHYCYNYRHSEGGSFSVSIHVAVSVKKGGCQCWHDCLCKWPWKAGTEFVTDRYVWLLHDSLTETQTILRKKKLLIKTKGRRIAKFSFNKFSYRSVSLLLSTLSLITVKRWIIGFVKKKSGIINEHAELQTLATWKSTFNTVASPAVICKEKYKTERTMTLILNPFGNLRRNTIEWLICWLFH